MGKVEVVEAIYEDGVLKPLKPLKLKEGEQLIIKLYRTDIIERTEKFRKILSPKNFKESPEEYLQKLREERI